MEVERSCKALIKSSIELFYFNPVMLQFIFMKFNGCIENNIIRSNVTSYQLTRMSINHIKLQKTGLNTNLLFILIICKILLLNVTLIFSLRNII